MKYTFLDYTSDFSNQATFARSVMDTSAHNDVFHLHPHCEFLISLEARAQKCIVQNRSGEIDYPCLSLKKTFLIHNDYLLEKPPLDVHIVYFTEEWLRRFAPTFDLGALFENSSVCIFDLSPYLGRFRRCVEIFDSYPPDSAGQRYAFLLILETVRQLGLTNRFRETINPKLSYIGEIMLDLMNDFDAAPKLPDYCRRYYVSSTKLYRDFRDYTGMTFNQFVLLVRVNEAKKMLSNTDLTVNEIALKLGFKDPTYFFPFFKKYTGMSPREYEKRKLH